uniref:hypothetical protein n=1 Tax=Flavobacterium sp. TaxID=239 RepID=UPI00404AC57E
MKNKRLLIAVIIFFLLVNTIPLWEAKMGMFAMLAFAMMVIYFIALLVFLIGQLFILFHEKFKNRKRLLLIFFMIFVLSTSFLFPYGFINLRQFEQEPLLIAQREGAANCMTTLILKANNKFLERNVCFGISETVGDHRISKDTIFFETVSLGRHENDFFEFAIINNKNDKNNSFGDLVRFKNKADSVGVALWITKNELKK